MPKRVPQNRSPITMIVDRYDPINLFEMVPKLNLQFEPELARLDELLNDDVLFEFLKADLSRRYPNSGKLGRHSTPVEVILRMLVVKRLYGWSYEQTERFVNDSIVLRQFTRVYLQREFLMRPPSSVGRMWSVPRRFAPSTRAPLSWTARLRSPEAASSEPTRYGGRDQHPLSHR